MSTQHSPSRGLAVGAVAVVLAGAGVVYWLKSDPSARTEAGVPAAAPPMAARLSVVEDATNPKPPAKNPDGCGRTAGVHVCSLDVWDRVPDSMVVCSARTRLI